jgi:hypothetical protein
MAGSTYQTNAPSAAEASSTDQKLGEIIALNRSPALK